MMRGVAVLVQRFREIRAARHYDQCVQYTSELYAQRSFIAAELRRALEAEAAAQARMKKIFSTTHHE